MLQDFLFLYFIAQFFVDNNIMSQCQNVELTYFQVKKKKNSRQFVSAPWHSTKTKGRWGRKQTEAVTSETGQGGGGLVSTLLYEFLSLSPFSFLRQGLMQPTLLSN